MPAAAWSVSSESPGPVFHTLNDARDAVTLSVPHTAYFQRFDFDPIGSTTVTFSGVNAGSEIRVYLPDGPDGSAGTEVAGLDSCAANQTLSWSVYGATSPLNTVWIHILKRGLRWMKFPYVSVSGNQTLPIFQIADLGYSNPA